MKIISVIEWKCYFITYYVYAVNTDENIQYIKKIPILDGTQSNKALL